jgi:uncharacterized protein (TIGR03905 family)
MYEYETSGTCSTKINFDIKDGKLSGVIFENGCNGNLKAISALVEGIDAADAVKKLKGIRCGNKKTSCGDQLAKAIEQFL